MYSGVPAPICYEESIEFKPTASLRHEWFVAGKSEVANQQSGFIVAAAVQKILGFEISEKSCISCLVALLFTCA